ncbi:MAG: TlpA family protein disulfide reductase [Lachnospiraceae bacterium]|nr:TlpA family protein disulfide reductase [Lachnospiraceae bacterium]
MKKIKILMVLLCLVMLGCNKKPEDILITEELKFDATEATTSEIVTTEADKESTSSTVTEESTEKKAYVLKFESTNLDGEKVTSDCFTNSKLTMINVWGTYCSPCLGEMPDLGEIANEYDKADFQLIGVVCDVEEGASKEQVDYVKSLVEKTKANYTHLLLSESLLNKLVSAVYYVPTTFFFNQDGELIGYVESAYRKDVWKDIIDGLLEDMQ